MAAEPILIRGRKVVGGVVEGEALVTVERISGWGGVDPRTGTVVETRHELRGVSFAGKVLQVGTVIEGSAEFYSSRLTKRERRVNLTEEVMADAGVAGYAKRKYRDIQAERDRPGRRGAGRGGRGGGKMGRKGR